LNTSREYDLIEQLVNAIGNEVSQGSFTDAALESEILLRRGKLAESQGDPVAARRLYTDALLTAKEENNTSARFRASWELGFGTAMYSAASIKDIAESQMEFIETIELSSRLDELIKVGQKLFKIWRTLEVRRLYEYDIPIKHSLMDNARAMHSIGMSSEVPDAF
jgi:hypothetical protein